MVSTLYFYNNAGMIMIWMVEPELHNTQYTWSKTHTRGKGVHSEICRKGDVPWWWVEDRESSCFRRRTYYNNAIQCYRSIPFDFMPSRYYKESDVWGILVFYTFTPSTELKIYLNTDSELKEYLYNSLVRFKFPYCHSCGLFEKISILNYGPVFKLVDTISVSWSVLYCFLREWRLGCNYSILTKIVEDWGHGTVIKWRIGLVWEQH